MFHVALFVLLQCSVVVLLCKSVVVLFVIVWFCVTVLLLCYVILFVYCQEKQGNIPKIEGTSGGICISFMYMSGCAHLPKLCTFCTDTGTVKMG